MAEIRYGRVDGELTQCIIVGRGGSEAESGVILALPWIESAHRGTWQPFSVENSETGETENVRLTLVVGNVTTITKPLRRRPYPSWVEQGLTEWPAGQGTCTS